MKAVRLCGRLDSALEDESQSSSSAIDQNVTPLHSLSLSEPAKRLCPIVFGLIEELGHKSTNIGAVARDKPNGMP